MSLRIRSDGRVLCAAMHEAEPGDVYLDDGEHYALSIEMGVLLTEPMELPEGVGRGGHARHGQWWWIGHIPDDVADTVDRWAVDARALRAVGSS